MLPSRLPLIQAPMVGSSSALAIAVCEAGGLGSLACAALGPQQLRDEIAAIRARTSAPFNVNFFCHTPPAPDAGADARWRAALADRAQWGKMRMDPTDLADVSAPAFTFLVNGRTAAENWTGLFAPGERIRLRFINAAAMTFFDVRIPGLPMTVVAADGRTVQPVTVDEFRIGNGDSGAGIGKIELQQVRRRQRVDQYRHETGAHRAEERGRIGRRVVEKHQHAIAALEPKRNQAMAPARGLCAEFLIGHIAVRAGQREVIAVSLVEIVEKDAARVVDLRNRKADLARAGAVARHLIGDLQAIG